jgi:hypothetical protein
LSAAPGRSAAADAWVDFSFPNRLRRVTSDAFTLSEGNCLTLTGLVLHRPARRLIRPAVVSDVVRPGIIWQADKPDFSNV